MNSFGTELQNICNKGSFIDLFIHSFIAKTQQQPYMYEQFLKRTGK